MTASEDVTADLGWNDVIDEFVDAVQQRDQQRQQQLLSRHPELRRWVEPLKELDSLANLTKGNDQPIGEKRSTDGAFPQIFDGRFELLEVIGRGGMGVVYRAHQAELGRSVALKMLAAGFVSAPELRRRFESEARIAAQLRHPNIVAIHEVGECAGQPYFTMDLIEGSSLSDHIERSPRSETLAVELLLPIVRAVEELHRHGILHRDLKPNNILIAADGTPLLVDFGLAKSRAHEQELTVSGTILGTPAYMSPEQAAGRVRHVDARSDVYSLGAILYALLCGQPPFTGEHHMDVILRVLERDPLPVRSWNPAVSPQLERICLKCLEKNPDRRYPSAAALAADLERWQRQPASISIRASTWDGAGRVLRRYPAAGYRVMMQLVAAAVIVVRCLLFPEYLGHYLPILGGLSLWAGLSLVWEWLAIRSPRNAGYAFLLTDTLLLTAILHRADAVGTPMVCGYPLIVTASSLWLDRRLLWGAAAASLLAYAGLLGAAPEYDWWHISLIMSAMLIVLTGLLDFQLRRLAIFADHREVELRSPSSDKLTRDQ